MRKLSEPLASQTQVDEQEVAAKAAAAECDAAKIALSRLRQTLAFQEQNANAELHAAEQSLALAEKGTGVESLKRRVELAELKLNQVTIAAPSNGMVLSVMAHPGEIVAQQPLLQLADLDHLVCVAEVDAGEVPALQYGQKATISCRAFHDSTLEGTLDHVGNQIAKATLRPLDPRKQVDRDVAKVVVQIDAKQAARIIDAAGKEETIARAPTGGRRSSACRSKSRFRSPSQVRNHSLTGAGGASRSPESAASRGFPSVQHRPIPACGFVQE